MNKQEIFDKVVAHARKQNKKAQAEDNYTCKYRTNDGLKCFIGTLIPDHLYDPIIEDNGLICLTYSGKYYRILSFIVRESGIDVDDKDMLHFAISLQKIHDNCPVSQWEVEFNALAERHNLKYSKP